MPNWKKLITSGSDAHLNTLELTNNTTNDSILITSTDAGSSAAPVITLKRNSSSPADADYLGQFKFKGENDADQEVVYAKITGKVQDASDGSEDGIIEFANVKAGSNTITARLRSDSLQLLNGTNLSVDGTIDGSSLTLDTALAVAEGGTGATSLTSNSLLTGNGTSAIQAESTLTWNGSDYLNIQSADGAEGGIKIKKSSTDATHTTYHISHRDDNQSLWIYSYDGTTYRNWMILDEPNAELKLASNSSNPITINSSGDLNATGDVVAYYSSDKRLKDNIVRIENPLEKIDKIGGYTFDWNDKQQTYTGKDVGVIAQEIQEVLPEIVTERDNGYLAVKYEKIVPLLIESIKELKQEVDEIKHKCDCLNK